MKTIIKNETAHPTRLVKKAVMNNAARRKSGFPIYTGNPHTSKAPSRYSIVSDADVKKRGVKRMLETLHADMAKLEKGVHEERRSLIASAYEVAKCLKTDKLAMTAFCRDHFWTGDLPGPKLNGKDLLRFVLIRVRGNTVEHRSTVSRWVKPLKAAFDAGKPSQIVPELLIEDAKRVTQRKKKTREEKPATNLTEHRATGQTTDLGKIGKADVFYGFSKHGKNVLEFDNGALDGLTAIVMFTSNKGTTNELFKRAPMFDLKAFRAKMAEKQRS